MLDFLRQLAPRNAEALRSASPLRRLATTEGPFDGSADVSAGSAFSRPGGSQTSAAPAATHPTRSEAAPRSPTTHGEASEQQRAATPPLAEIAYPAAAVRAGAEVVVAPAFAGSDRDPTQAVERQPLVGGPRDGAEPRLAESLASPPSPSPAPVELVETARPSSRTLAPLSNATVALAQERSVVAAPPAIHVTIDRIEVRAPAQASKSAPRPTRSSPTTQSLHDYLRQKGQT